MLLWKLEFRTVEKDDCTIGYLAAITIHPVTNKSDNHKSLM